MELKKYEDLTQEEKWRLSTEYKNNCGKDSLANMYDIIIFFAGIIAVPLAIIGFLLREQENYIFFGIIGCVLSVVLIILYVLNKRFRKKRAVTRPAKVKELVEAYGEDNLKQWYDEWYRHINNIPEPKSAAEIALENTLDRLYYRKTGTGTYSTSAPSTDNTMRVKLKDGKELHTEERFGDYKTYLYDESGKNTGLHVQDNKVLDDNYKEVGRFDSSGKFNPKN